jgi:hypothetical protein
MKQEDKIQYGHGGKVQGPNSLPLKTLRLIHSLYRWQAILWSANSHIMRSESDVKL